MRIRGRLNIRFNSACSAALPSILAHEMLYNDYFKMFSLHVLVQVRQKRFKSDYYYVRINRLFISMRFNINQFCKIISLILSRQSILEKRNLCLMTQK